jgi:hypothetical protein
VPILALFAKSAAIYGHFRQKSSPENHNPRHEPQRNRLLVRQGFPLSQITGDPTLVH